MSGKPGSERGGGAATGWLGGCVESGNVRCACLGGVQGKGKAPELGADRQDLGPQPKHAQQLAALRYYSQTGKERREGCFCCFSQASLVAEINCGAAADFTQDASCFVFCVSRHRSTNNFERHCWLPLGVCWPQRRPLPRPHPIFPSSFSPLFVQQKKGGQGASQGGRSWWPPPAQQILGV